MLENIIWLIISVVCVSNFRDSQPQDHFTACEIFSFFGKRNVEHYKPLKLFLLFSEINRVIYL